MNRIIDEKGLKLLAECEGLKLKSYKCPAGIWTIGLGNTFYEDGRPVKKGDTITKDRALQLFWKIEPKFRIPINESVKVELTQNQFNAIFIFAWNIGPTAFKKSTLLKRINDKESDGKIKEAFLMWKGKKDLLLSRRNKEIQMFFS